MSGSPRPEAQTPSLIENRIPKLMLQLARVTYSMIS